MKKRLKFHTTLNSRKGSTSVIILCTTLVILIASAFISDLIYAAVNRYNLDSSARQAAGKGAEALLKSRKDAEDIIRYTAQKNIALDKLEVRIADNSREISVYMEEPFKYLFLKFLGVSGKELKTQVTVKLSGVKSIKGAKPFVVQRQSFQFGRSITLTNRVEGGSDKIAFIPLKPDSGSVRDNMIFGNPVNQYTKDKVLIDTKDIYNEIYEGVQYLIEKCRRLHVCSFEALQPDCPRIVTVPVVDRPGNPDEKTVSIAGFASFYIENCSKTGGTLNLTGRFIKHTVDAVTSDDAEDFGLVGVTVIK